VPVKGEPGGEGRRFGDALAEDDGQHQADEAEHRGLADPARADDACPDAHDEGDRHGGGDGEGAPGAVGQRLDHDQRQHRQDDDHDQEGAEQRDHAGDEAELGPDQLAQRPTVAAHRDEQDHEVLHRARQHHPGQDPQRAGQVAHLRRQHRADQRAGARDGGEVVAE
jgi:hypothetical protein